MKAGEDELNRAFWITFKQIGSLSTFYSVMVGDLSSGAAKQMLEMKSTCEEIYKDGTLASWLTESEKVNDFYKLIQEQQHQVHQKIIDDAKKARDAIAIVFAHGILDASVYRYLEVLSLALPESFKIYTKNKKVCLLDVESNSYDKLHRQKIKEFMERKVEKESLIYKLDIFHEITKPLDTQMNPNYNYEREKLVKFDKARHSIVHKNDWSSYAIDFTKESFYWGLLNFYLLKLVVKRTGLKLSQKGGYKYLLG